jgi:N-acylneuraminate cytidylyltransferase
LQEDGSLKMLFPEYYHSRSQDLDLGYHDAGQFYWASTAVWLEDRTDFSERSTIVKIPPYRVVDIDTEEDWLRAELIFKTLGLDKK